MILQGQIVDKTICILSGGSQFMLNKRNEIVHLWSPEWQKYPQNCVYAASGQGSTTATIIYSLSATGKQWGFSWSEKKEKNVYF